MNTAHDQKRQSNLHNSQVLITINEFLADYASQLTERFKMNISQLRYFAETVRLGSYAAAAKALYVTPPAISKSINDLETELKVKLLVRTGRNVGPTDFGKAFFEKTKEILGDIEALESMAEAAANSKDKSGSVTIAAAISPCRSTIVDHHVFASFKEAHPEISLSVIRCSSGASLSALEDGIVDAAIVIGRVDRRDIVTTRLYSMQPSVAVHKNYRLAKNKSISLEQLASCKIGRPNDVRFCYPKLLERFKKLEIEPHFVELLTEQDNIDFVTSGEGVLLVTPEPNITRLYPDTAFLPLSNSETSVPIHFVHSVDKNLYCMNVIRKHIKTRQRFALGRSSACSA